MPDEGTPSSPRPTHTSTHEWQSFEMRMRRRRAERCLLRAEIALDAGFEEEAREALDEARRLDWQSPEFESLKARIAQRHAAEAAERNARRRRVYAIVAALVLATAAGAWLLQRDPAGRAPATIETAAPAQAQAPAAPVGESPPEPATTPTVVPEQQLISAEAVAPPIVPDERLSPSRNERDAEPAVRQPALADVKANLTLLEALNRNNQRTPPVLEVAVPTSSAPAPQPAPVSVGSLGKSVAETPLSMPETTRVPGLPPAPVTPPPAPRMAPAAPAPAPPDDSGVRAVLARYESAYSTLNASAARAVWPGAPGSLQRAFDALEAQQVSLGPCSITLNGSSARANCPGQTTWTPKVGGGTHSASRRWNFELANAGGAWKITRVDVR